MERIEGVEWKTLAQVGVVGGNPDAAVAIVAQGTDEWLRLRCGVITASQIGTLITTTGKVSTGKTRETYINKLIAEALTGEPEPSYESAAMARGTALEPEARLWYRFEAATEVAEVGFVFGDESGTFGFSPDGLTHDRIIEIKCPMPHTMVGYLRGGKMPTAYIPQVQFGMWVMGLPLCDFILYSGVQEIPHVAWTVEADAALHAVYATQVPEICAEIQEGIENIRNYTGEGR